MDIMMTYGVFPFMISTVAYEKMQREFEYKWAEQDRLPHSKLYMAGIGGPALQYMGPGAQTVTIDGAIYPNQVGMPSSLAALRLLANLGEPELLISTSGGVMGNWIIKQISETNSEFRKFGTFVDASKIEFSITLQRYINYKTDAKLLLLGGGIL